MSVILETVSDIRIKDFGIIEMKKIKDLLILTLFKKRNQLLQIHNKIFRILSQCLLCQPGISNLRHLIPYFKRFTKNRESRIIVIRASERVVKCSQTGHFEGLRAICTSWRWERVFVFLDTSALDVVSLAKYIATFLRIRSPS